MNHLVIISEVGCALTFGVEDNFKRLAFELAMIKDIGSHLVSLCYALEGDAASLPFVAYDRWKAVLKQLKVMADTDKNIRKTFPTKFADHFPTVWTYYVNVVGIEHDVGDVYYDPLVDLACDCAKKVYAKMNYDTSQRLSQTMNIFQACRFLDYSFIARHALPAIQGEAIQLCRLGFSDDEYESMETELPEYWRLATTEATVGATTSTDEDLPMDQWMFWKKNSLKLPLLYDAAKKAVLMAPSSATVERLFSYLSMGFSDNQQAALEDYKSAGVMLRYNEKMRKDAAV